MGQRTGQSDIVILRLREENNFSPIAINKGHGKITLQRLVHADYFLRNFVVHTEHLKFKNCTNNKQKKKPNKQYSEHVVSRWLQVNTGPNRAASFNTAAIHKTSNQKCESSTYAVKLTTGFCVLYKGNNLPFSQ